MSGLASLALVFLGAGTGGALRHVVNLAALRALGDAFPYGIFLINVTGSLVMGVFAGWLAGRAGAPWASGAKLFFATGVLGGYTTFSSFSLDAAAMLEEGAFGLALLYMFGSLLAGLAACAIGLLIGRALG